jgi:hypothetical protein
MPYGAAVVDAMDELEQGREAYARRAWRDAYESLSDADQAAPLGAEDLELLATSAYMVGHDNEYLSDLERAHHAYADAGEALRAVRCAFWVSINLARRGEMGRASGWLGRSQRLLDREEHDCVGHGYMLLPAMFQHEATGDHDAAVATAAKAAQIGEPLATSLRRSWRRCANRNEKGAVHGPSSRVWLSRCGTTWGEAGRGSSRRG